MAHIVIDISSRSEGLAKTLSNFERRPFRLGGWIVLSIESALQAVKFKDVAQQSHVSEELHGYKAWKYGQDHGSGWKLNQTLWWQGQPMGRESADYADWLHDLYTAQYEQSRELREDLLATVGFKLRHTRGLHDPQRTVLTEVEYLAQLNRLRFKALGETTETYLKRYVQLASVKAD